MTRLDPPTRAGAIVVLARSPRPGRVKTRMSPPFSHDQAAAFYGALLADVLATTAAAARELGLDPIVAVDPPEACGGIATAAPSGFRVVAQRGPDLSRRMEWAVREVAAAGCRRILLRGSDSPLLGVDTLRAALSGLEDADLVLCPDRDGGYSLVGLRRPAPGLFSHPMSTSTVLEDTLERAKSRGLTTGLLEPSFDIDTVDDLTRLAAARARGEAGPCPRTIAYLDENELW